MNRKEIMSALNEAKKKLKRHEAEKAEIEAQLMSCLKRLREVEDSYSAFKKVKSFLSPSSPENES
ncbi:MAG: hypothetical protein ACOX5T_02570 [Candidatus Cryptobacteroides sp.]|jgi:hypothetical protein